MDVKYTVAQLLILYRQDVLSYLSILYPLGFKLVSISLQRFLGIPLSNSRHQATVSIVLKMAIRVPITAFRKQFVWAHCQLEPGAYSHYLNV